MKKWLEVRIPISPRSDYFNRVRLIAYSIRSLGGRYADVPIGSPWVPIGSLRICAPCYLGRTRPA